MERIVTVVSAELLSNNLRDLLAKREMSQEEFSEKLGVSFRQVNRIVLGQSVPSLLLALKMCVVLKADLNKIFKVRFVRDRVKVKDEQRTSQSSHEVSATT